MSKSSESSVTASTGTTTGGGGTKGPHPKRVAEIILLLFILGFVIYNTYILTQQGKILQGLQVAR